MNSVPESLNVHTLNLKLQRNKKPLAPLTDIIPSWA